MFFQELAHELSSLTTNTDFWVLFFLALALIHVFYFVLKTRWPEVYFSVGDATSSFISVEPKRYFLFRFGPVLFAGASMFAVLGGVSLRQRIFAGLLLGLTHAGLTNFKSVIDLAGRKRKKGSNEMVLVAVHLFAATAVILAGGIAGFLSSLAFVKGFVPSFSAIRDNLWSSAILGIFIVFFYKLFQRNESIPYSGVFNSMEKIPKHLKSYIQKAANRNNANKDLLMAIAIVENMQRPGWFRCLEWVKSFVFPEGTYGIMQVYAKHYLSDEESIDFAASEFFRNSNDEMDSEDYILSKIKDYNSDEKYVDLVTLAYQVAQGGEETG
ncbi:MAG: hypothetical protein ABH826_04795 [Patescibacteria group bacterium]